MVFSVILFLFISMVVSGAPLHGAASSIHLTEQSCEELFRQGLHFEQNNALEDAEKFYQAAAERGYAKAQCNLGVILENRGEIGQAKEWYRKAAEQNLSHAQANLAELLEKEHNHEEAMRFYRLAAEQGHKEAQYRLGLFL
jgi:hypothetical protein